MHHLCARRVKRGAEQENLRALAGKPLLVHSIEQARESGLFERIAVSSDAANILNVAKAAGADDLVERPDEMATDTAAKVPAIHHALKMVERRRGVHFDILVDLDATSPLRIVNDIRGAVEMQQRTRARSVITGAPSHRSPYFNLVEETPDGTVQLSKPLPSEVARRQDAPRTFDMNASIYVWDAPAFRDDPKVFYPETRLFEMPPERSLDIDTPLDFDIVEFLWQRRQQ